MKLYGGGRSASKRTAGTHSNTSYYRTGEQYGGRSGAAPRKRKKRLTRKQKFVRVLVVLLVLLMAAAAGLYAVYKIYVKPPEVSDAKRPSVTNGEGDVNMGRSGDKYTFVVLGMDDGNGNTDTMMAVTFDTQAYQLTAVSIPRDTLVNVSWSVKKANTLYAYGGTDVVIEGLADILGYEVDFYVIVDLEAFQVMVDAIGGVDYDVPVTMNYEDPYQNLYIHLNQGM